MRITLKVHLMHKHVRWQMENIIGGMGDKVEDGIEIRIKQEDGDEDSSVQWWTYR